MLIWFPFKKENYYIFALIKQGETISTTVLKTTTPNISKLKKRSKNHNNKLEDRLPVNAMVWGSIPTQEGQIISFSSFW